VCDANGQSLAYVYSREKPNDHMAKVLTEAEASDSLEALSAADFLLEYDESPDLK